MKVALIGRTEMLFGTAIKLLDSGFEIPLIVTAREAPEYKKTAQDFAGLARKIGAEFIDTARINDPTIIEQIRALGAIDIAASVNYINVISAEVIQLFPLGILNAHGGDLPRYRGNACQAWAIIKGEDRVGLCVHKMVADELDSGDILARDYMALDINSKIGEVQQWMAERVPSLMMEAIEGLRADPAFAIEVQSKDPADALRCYPRIPTDGRIDWRSTSSEIVRLVNASSEPYPGAFCEFDGERMIVWEAELRNDVERVAAVPGQVSRINDDGTVDVITGHGKVRIVSVESNGVRAVPGNFIRTIRKRLE